MDALKLERRALIWMGSKWSEPELHPGVTSSDKVILRKEMILLVPVKLPSVE